MSIQEYIASERKIQAAILNFIEEESESESESKYHELSTLLADPKILKNKEELKQVILIISNISGNHHHSPNFFHKIGRIIELIKNDLTSYFKNSEICTFFMNNKRTLLLLQKAKIITINKEFISYVKSLNNYDYEELSSIANYFSPELNNGKTTNFSGSLDNFYDLREKGENDSYICDLIRKDSIEDFISHVNKTGISLDSQINESIFETNQFLYGKTPQLIEYALFFGSIQIFKYLQQQKIELKPKLWLYAIHSNSAEMIHFLIENKIKPEDESYEECLVESIKCHHNDIASYIRDSLMTEENKKKVKFYIDQSKNYEIDNLQLIKSPVIYHNFEFFPDDFNSLFNLIFYFIHNQYSTIVQLLNENNQYFINVNDYKKNKDFQYYNSFFKSFVVNKNGDTKNYVIKTAIENPCADEFSLMLIYQYPSLLKIKGYSPIDFDHKNHLTILTDYYNYTLQDYIDNKIQNINYTKTNEYIIILGLTIGLKHLQDNNIHHAFLYPSSILLDENLYPIISNIDISEKMISRAIVRIIPESKNLKYYNAPEVNEGYVLSSSNDFSYSFILYYLITKKHPFDDYIKGRILSDIEVSKEISNGYRPRCNLIENENVKLLLKFCWDPVPEMRPKFEIILKFITNDEFYSYFEPFDHESVKKYLDIYGDEFNEIKNHF